MKTICVKCEVEYKIVKNGNPVIEMFSNPPQPYKIWSADKWQCPICYHQIISGFAFNPIAEHFEDGFDAILDKVKKTKSTIYSYEVKEIKKQ